ncbi:MAG: NF038130 family PEP-CTERM protein, partial [Cyanobacteriota bacterium]|nr:NF038130 family PEP-CTERM protein [Cyanobacteriota bacterium]
KGTLTADFGNGFDVTFSSLTAVDWFGTGLNTNYGANNLANRWFSAALASNGGKLGYLVETEFGGNVAAAFNFFLNHKGFQRLSDPNIAYVHKIGSAVNFGLAGHQNAGQVFDNPALQQLFAGIHASEVFAITYKGDTSYGYSFDEPFTSGVVNAKDGFSHNGTFDFTLVTLDNPELPEPSAAIALMAVGGGLVALKKRSNNE